MNTSGWLQLALYVIVLLLLAKPLGGYMAAVYEGRAMRAQRIGGWLERLIHRGGGVDAARDMSWIEYALAMLWFNLLGALVVYALAAPAGLPAAQSAGHGGGVAGLGVQHRDELRHQHQLAGLRRREHDELSRPRCSGSASRTSSPPRPAWRCWSR